MVEGTAAARVDFSLPSHPKHARYLQTQLKTKNRQDLEQDNKFTVLLNFQILPMLLQGLRDTIPASRGQSEIDFSH